MAPYSPELKHLFTLVREITKVNESALWDEVVSSLVNIDRDLGFHLKHATKCVQKHGSLITIYPLPGAGYYMSNSLSIASIRDMARHVFKDNQMMVRVVGEDVIP